MSLECPLHHLDVPLHHSHTAAHCTSPNLLGSGCNDCLVVGLPQRTMPQSCTFHCYVHSVKYLKHNAISASPHALPAALYCLLLYWPTTTTTATRVMPQQELSHAAQQAMHRHGHGLLHHVEVWWRACCCKKHPKDLQRRTPHTAHCPPRPDTHLCDGCTQCYIQQCIHGMS